MLIDSDVLIWYLRGNVKAQNVIEKTYKIHISVITYMELVQGMRNKAELNLFKNTIKNWNVKIIHISEEISSKAMFYVEQFYLSDSMEIADSLIASTASTYGLPLITGNAKHYKPVKDLEIIDFKP